MPDDSRSAPVIVAIGASAGGLKAFEFFFKAAALDLGVAYVVITHLDPRRDSLMVDLISNYTRMPVSVIRDGMPVKGNHVYVIPPNSFVTLHEGRLRLQSPIETHGSRMAIDIFFRSLAEGEGQRAIGVVLSGTGTDGTLGAKAIKESGGMVMAQDPQSAEHDGMPRSAIGAGVVDFVLAPGAMPDTLKRYVQHQYVRGSQGAIEATEDEQTDDIDKALTILLARTGRDFRHYKRGTIGRRMQRRMGLRQIHGMPEYVALLRKDEDEARLLVDDLLIGVTQFYRDPRAFEKLEKEVLSRLMDRKREKPVRIWVPGCSTGEEAYSLAISCLEVADQAGRQPEVQVFATDLDERALAVARAALYPESIAGDVPADRLARYFTKEEHRYRVNKNVRELVVFAPQDLIRDAPFSRLDLVSCRNLLIYLEPDVQQRVFALLCFALVNDGHLFLGNSETISLDERMFKVVDKSARIYRKVRSLTVAGRAPIPFGLTASDRRAGHDADEAGRNQKVRAATLIRTLMLEEVVPASVAVAADYKIIYSSGRIGEFLGFASGEPTNDLLALVRHGLRFKLRRLVRNVLASGKPASETAEMPESGRKAFIEARRITHPKLTTPLCLISFRTDPPKAGAARKAAGKAAGKARKGSARDLDEAVIAQLEQDLKASREELQGTIEELESANEELQTSNEEAMSINEELQSSNEELETSKEELQSLNEEVNTVNTELQEKIQLLEKANNDLNNLLGGTNIATLFLDLQAVIRRFTPTAQRLFKLIESDVGRPIQDITHRLRTPMNLAADVRRASTNLQVIEDEVEDDAGQWYARRVAPYRTSDNRIEGAVVTFSDITRLKVAEGSLRESEARYRSLYEDNPAIYLTLDQDLVIRAINHHGAEQLNAAPEDLVGKSFADLYSYPERTRTVLLSALGPDGDGARWEARMSLPGSGEPWTRGVARRIEQDGKPSLLVSLLDISAEKRLSDSVYFHSTHDYLTGLLNRREFDSILARICEGLKANEASHALIYLDLANFKLINDTAGHAAGDQALRQVADILRSGGAPLRQRDVVARLGGDEFAVVLEHCPAGDAVRVAEQIVASLQDVVFKWEQHEFPLQCYIGVVPVSDPKQAPEEVLRAADAACYEARTRGPGSIHAAGLAVDEVAQRRTEMDWARILREALASNGFWLNCEPMLDAADKVVGYEFLLRLRNEHVKVGTSSLIKAAERYGLARDVDLFVLETALSQLSRNLRLIEPVAFFSINVSGQSLGREDFSDRVEALVRRSNVPPTKLCFEITETAAVSNIKEATAFTQRLRGLGCRIALDDFGSGLSSFYYLKNLPCDLLKIDGAFIRDVVVNDSDRALVSAIHGIARLFGVATVAEYVESEEISQVVRQIGVDYRQGHLFRPQGTLEEVLRARA